MSGRLVCRSFRRPTGDLTESELTWLDAGERGLWTVAAEDDHVTLRATTAELIGQRLDALCAPLSPVAPGAAWTRGRVVTADNGGCCQRVLALCDEADDRLQDEGVRQAVQDVRVQLSEPLRVAVAAA